MRPGTFNWPDNEVNILVKELHPDRMHVVHHSVGVAMRLVSELRKPSKMS